ncbi:hypothetical protein A3Q56_06863 [Intoshia linei]|uniref:Uncharacterized protein n=1 Tax=Intoshia linei TaxID=1819745 RepID=A0A177AW16_9BILA|nr:hypothetical protein A3Q56_06863 [Intoshia linei]
MFLKNCSVTQVRKNLLNLLLDSDNITSENDLNHHLKTFDDNFFVFEIIKQDASLLENIFLNINETTQKGLIKEFKQKFVEKINHISIGVQTQNIAKTCNTPISVESSETPESFNTKTAASTTTTSSHSIKSCFQSGHEKNVEKVENDSYESGCKSDDSSVQKNSVGEGSSIPSINKLELKSNDIDSPHNSSIVCSRSNNEIKYSNSQKSEISEILENIKKKKSLNNSNTISECSSILHNKILQSSLESIIRKSTSKSTLGKFDDGNIDQQNKTQNISKSKKNVYHSDAFDSDSESSPIFKSKSRDSFKMDSPFSGNMSVPQRKPSKIQRRKSAKTRKAKSFSKSPTLQKSESFRDILNVDTNMKNSFSNIKPSDKISIKLSSSNESDFNKSQKNENIFLNSLSEIIQNFIFRFSDLLNNYGYNTFSILLDEVENNIKSRISYSLIYKTLNDLFHIIFDNMTNMLSQESVSELWNLTRNESLILPPKKCDETSVSVDNFVSQSHAVQTAPIVYDDFVKEFNEKKNVLFESPKKQGPQNSKILDYKIKNREIDQLNNLFIYFSKMNQNRNRRMLDNALCRRKIKQDLHTKLSKEMAQYRQISRSQLHLLIVKYSLVKNMEFIKTKMTDEKVFDKLYKYEGKKIKSFKLIQNRLHEARNILAEKLSFAFSNLQQESGLFLIKPIYSYSKIQSLLYEPIEIDDKKKRIMINPYKNQKNKEITVSGTQVTRKNGSNIYKSKVWIPDEATNQAYNSVCKNMPTLLDIDVSRIVYRHNLPL